MVESSDRPWTLPEVDENVIGFVDPQEESNRLRPFREESSSQVSSPAPKVDLAQPTATPETPEVSQNSAAAAPDADVSDEQFKYHWERDMQGFRKELSLLKANYMELKRMYLEEGSDKINDDVLVESGDLYREMTRLSDELEVETPIEEIRVRLRDRADFLDEINMKMHLVRNKCVLEIKRVRAEIDEEMSNEFKSNEDGETP